MTSYPARALIASLAIVATLALLVPRTARAQTPGFTGTTPGPGEQALLVTTAAAGPADLVAALGNAGCTVETLAVIEASAWATYVSGAPDFANADFPQQLAAGAPFYVRCAGSASSSFDQFSASGGQSGLMATQVGTRVAAHAGYDRFVIEFDGDAVPEYAITYENQVNACGSGEPVDLAGGATIQVNLPQTFVYDPDTGESTVPTRTITLGGTELKEAREICGFEGQAIWALGVTSRQGFRVFELAGPTRLVIDVAHPSGS